MDIDDFQIEALGTQQPVENDQSLLSVCLLGLSGEVGELLTEYKKNIRDGESYNNFREKVTEELGDILWYVSSIASFEDIQMSEVLSRNIQKVNDRWAKKESFTQLQLEPEFLDDDLDDDLKFPREFVAEIEERVDENGVTTAVITLNGKKFGHDLKDNSYSDDFYRFHDIFHFSYVVVLGWSPVVRGFLKKKRKYDPKKDEVEDGGRAIVIEEAISALVFEYAHRHSYLEGISGVDYDLLRTIKMLTKDLEVKSCSMKQWEEAILLGFKIWRQFREHRKGRVVCNMLEKTMVYEPI